MRFSYTISYVPVVTDALSRALVSSSTHTDNEFQAEVEMFANTVVQSVPATEKSLKEIQKAQEADKICQKLYQYCKSGWPHRQRNCWCCSAIHFGSIRDNCLWWATIERY